MFLEIARDGGGLLAVHLKDDGAMLARRDFHVHIFHVHIFHKGHTSFILILQGIA